MVVLPRYDFIQNVLKWHMANRRPRLDALRDSSRSGRALRRVRRALLAFLSGSGTGRPQSAVTPDSKGVRQIRRWQKRCSPS